MNYVYEKDGAAIYQRSFAIIRSEAKLDRFDPARRKGRGAHHPCQRHGRGRRRHRVHRQAFGGGRRTALRAGAPIFCDAQMVANGITRARLPADNEVICTLSDPRVPALAAQLGTTRTAAAMELWRDRLAGSVVVIGNAPTALFRLLEMLQEPGVAPPAAMIGIPVGFVGAAESKEALIEQRRGAERDRARPARRQRDGGGGGQRRGERNRMTTPATIYGVGLGPGDPELMSVKAARLIGTRQGHRAFPQARPRRQCPHAGRRPAGARRDRSGDGISGHDRDRARRSRLQRERCASFYDDCVAALAGRTPPNGRDVMVLCEGDPFLYGSFMHLHSRLDGRAPVVVVPGISGMSRLLDRERPADHLWRRRAERGAGDARRGQPARAVSHRSTRWW